MGVTNSDKTLSVSRIDCGGTFNVKLSLAAEPSIVANPADIVLILDRSGSMAGSALASLKNGAKKFIDIIDESTDGSQDGQIGGGSRIGIVSFADTAVQNTQLITSVADLKAAVDALSAGGSTNHADAFAKANALFSPASSNARVLVMFTDGNTTAGPDPAPFADAAKAEGAVIYCIGLVGNGGIDEQALRDWASDPDSAYVAIAPDDTALEDLFEDLAENISKPGATNIVIDEKVTSCFRILSIMRPSKGMANFINDTTLQWKIDELGATQSEGAVLEFTVLHEGPCSGEVPVNEYVRYSDDEGNVVDFPQPLLDVDCGTTVNPEPCPEPVEIAVDGCQDTVEYDAGDLMMDSLGRILQLDVKLKKVCPYKRVALAAIVTEVDPQGIEHKRGLKTMTIPAHTRPMCRDVTVRCIKFVLPEDINVSCDNVDTGICCKRNIRARFIAHYVDNDFDCCDQLQQS